MKLYILPVLCAFALLPGMYHISAQTASDAIMMKKGEICLAIDYNKSSWDQYWEGTYLRSNGNVATLLRDAATPMIAAGLSDRVNLIVALPYIRTRSSQPNGGKIKGAAGLQDLFADLKVHWLEQPINNGNLSLMTNFGFGTPVGNYLSDYMPYSLGLGATEWSARGIIQYKWNSGWFIRGAAAHLWRGLTEIERDYYYNNGSYYTPFMDVPNAWNFHAVAGLWLFDNALRAEVNGMSLLSTSGDDIRPYNTGQPTNRMELYQAGAMLQYYFKNIRGLGLFGYYSQVIHGRNIGKSTFFGGGITYQFNILKSEKNEK